MNAINKNIIIGTIFNKILKLFLILMRFEKIGTAIYDLPMVTCG